MTGIAMRRAMIRATAGIVMNAHNDMFWLSIMRSTRRHVKMVSNIRYDSGSADRVREE